ncbi:DUF1223 domain-containing protein [Cognaticolwellia mytili]|uniref:DUF1223 domain-containing protein n=1 Tax=Cognaticolwellia mytili TaxID=1888913 RepID=UPI000A175027|nr:DUF1223 domain-containing protein [Cognaticolwellia mytili]
MSYKFFSIILFVYLYSALANAKTIISPEHQVNLVEVYSSQGCSSCPPAERWLGQFINAPKLFTSFIPINFHVDYWDYLGWKDPYANAKFTKRQRRYNILGHARTIATPGFIVNGKGWEGWFRGQNLPINNDKKVGRLTINLEEDTVKDISVADIKFAAIANAPNNGRVHLAVLAFNQKTSVIRGENRGKQLPHDFVVIGYETEKAQRKNNYFTAKLTLPNVEKFQSVKKALVVWISSDEDPSPIQAAGDWL